MRKVLLWTTLMVLALFSVSFVGVVSAALPTMYIDPYDAELEGVAPGQLFTVNVCVENVKRLWGYQFELSFNPAVIQGVMVENGPFLGSAGGEVLFVPGQGFDNTAGTLSLAAGALYPKARFPTGSGILAFVTFEIVGSGESDILFGPETGLADEFGRWIIKGEGEPGHVTVGTLVGFELYIRTRGAEGVSGIWEEWQVGTLGQEQTLYSRIMNYGEASAQFQVRFRWKSTIHGWDYIWSNPAEVGPRQPDGTPGEVVVSATFTPPGIGKYYCMGAIFYEAGLLYYRSGVESFVALYDAAEGIGISRDTNVAFKVTG